MKVLQVQEYNKIAINKYGYEPIHLFLNYKNYELRKTGYVAYNEKLYNNVPYHSIALLRDTKKQAIKDFTETIIKKFPNGVAK